MGILDGGRGLVEALLERYPDGLDYKVYYLITSTLGLLSAYAAYLLARPKI